MKRALSVFMFILLLVSMLTVAFNIQPVETQFLTLTVPDDSAATREIISLVRAQAEASYIIVHAHNPEGVEIASIEGMNQYSVEIYDGDTLIGYGAHDVASHNQPITTSSGSHAFKVKFNGIVLEQEININPFETQILTFAFTRRVWDFKSFLNSIGYFYAENPFVMSGTGGWYDLFFHTLPHPPRAAFGSVGLFFPTEPGTVSGKVWASFDVNANSMTVWRAASNVEGYNYWLQCQWPGDRAVLGYQIDEFVSNPPDFDYWYEQTKPTSNIYGTARLRIAEMGVGMWELTNTPNYTLVEVSKTATGSNLYLLPDVDSCYSQAYYWVEEEGGGHWESWYVNTEGYGTFTNDEVYFSSIPYDLLGTGVKDALDDLFVVSIEPIQVIRDAEALVANKSSAVLVTISSTFPTRVWAEINATYNFGTRWYIDPGPYLNGTPIDPGINRVYIPGGPVMPTAHPYPWRPAGQGLLWTSTGFDSDIKAVIDPSNKIPETDETNNEKTCGMKVVESKPLKILVFPVYFPLLNQSPFYPKPNLLYSQRGFLQRTYPVANDKLTAFLRNAMPIWQMPPAPYSEGELEELTKKRDDWLYHYVALPVTEEAKHWGYDNDRVVIIIDYRTGWAGWAPGMFKNNPIPVFVQNSQLGKQEDLVAHEIGHTYHLWHPHHQGPPPGSGVYDAYRFWVEMKDYEDYASTFMSYRSELPAGVPRYVRWIDKGRFDSNNEIVNLGGWSIQCWNLLDQLTTNPAATSMVSSSSEVVLVSGTLFRNDTIAIDRPWYRMSEGVVDLSPGTVGNYSMVLLNSEWQVLSQMGFNATFLDLREVNGTLTEVETEEFTFIFNIPYVSETAFIEIRNATDHVLASKSVSLNAPMVNITFPNGGEILTAGVNYEITWEALDLDGDGLTFLVASSYDCGESWIPLALDITENSCVWDTSGLRSGDNYIVKVIATDGVNTGEDVSDSAFTVFDLTPPTIEIASPQGKTYYSNSIPLTFETNELTWWIGYSIDDQANITLDSNTIINIEDGLHQIVLYANDTSGNMGSSEIIYFNVDSSLYDPWKSSFIGFDGYPIVDFATYDERLYAAADNNLYEYDGNSWNIMKAPTYVTSLEPHEDKLVIGGQGGLHYYDGTAFDLIFSVPTYIKVFGAYNNTLYAGTMLDNPPKLYYCNGSADNPADWHVDTGFSTILNFSGPFGSIDSFAEYNGILYITSGGTIYSFNGTDWNIANTFDDVYGFSSMKVYDSKLYLATRDQGWRKPLYQGGSGFSGRVIEYDGENWTTVLDHDYWIYSLEEYDGKLYAGTANRIFTYNGTDWEASFNTTEGAYYAISMITYDGKIYAGMGNGYIFADPAPPKTNPEAIVVPEFSSNMILAVFMVMTMLAVALTRKNRSRRFS